MNTKNIWKVGAISEDVAVLSVVNNISARFGITPTCAKLLYLRGYDTPEKAETFLRKNDSSIYNPFAMKDMDKAARRILDAVEKGEHTVVFGDYDADGVSSTAILAKEMRALFAATAAALKIASTCSWV